MVEDVKVNGRKIKFSSQYKWSKIRWHAYIFQRHYLGGSLFPGKLIQRVKNKYFIFKQYLNFAVKIK